MKPHGGRGPISRAQLADACDISRAAVTKWFNGNPPVTELKRPNLMAVAKLCGVRPEWLADGSLPMRGSVESGAPPSLWGLEGVTREAAELGRDWQQLDEPLRSAMRDLITMAVAAQKRRKRSSTSKSTVSQPLVVQEP